MPAKAMKDRIKESIGSGGKASMVPAPPEPTVKVPTEIPWMETLIKDPKEQTEIINLVAQYKYVQEEVSKLDKQKDKLSAAIKLKLVDHEIDTMNVQGLKVTKYVTQRSSIDGLLLLSNGVAQKIIDASTKTTAAVSLRITEIKE